MTAPRDDANDLATFETFRGELVALAYRMLGDLARAEDMVQEAWLRWQQRGEAEVHAPRAFLATVVTRLCLNELASARAQREESRGDRLPEPVDLAEGGLARADALEQVSMAMLVVLQKLSPAERAVVLLHDVFDFPHDEIAPLLGRTPAACRKLLERAREGVAAGRRMVKASREEHARLLAAFVRATTSGDTAALVELLADDAVLIADGGPGGRTVAGVRNLPRPLEGAARIAAFAVATTRRGAVAMAQRELNGQPALVISLGDETVAVLMLAVADGKIQRVFVQADPSRLRHVGRSP